MAKSTAPFLSLSASGQFAKTLVAATWKGIPYMRKYVVPANPNTDAQAAHRAVWSAAVAAYKTYLTDAGVRTAWRLAAAHIGAVMTGFNAAAQALVGILKTDPDGSFATAVAEALGVCSFTMENMDDGATGDEAGDFEVWRGLSAANLSLAESVAIAAGVIAHTHSLVAGTVYYIQIRKDGFNRSGIHTFTSATP
jgi:hypothetical protein